MLPTFFFNMHCLLYVASQAFHELFHELFFFSFSEKGASDLFLIELKITLHCQAQNTFMWQLVSLGIVSVYDYRGDWQHSFLHI